MSRRLLSVRTHTCSSIPFILLQHRDDDTGNCNFCTPPISWPPPPPFLSRQALSRFCNGRANLVSALPCPALLHTLFCPALPCPALPQTQPAPQPSPLARPAQPSPPPPQPTNPKTWIGKKNSVKTRSKLSVKTFGQNLLAPKPLTISINPKP